MTFAPKNLSLKGLSVLLAAMVFGICLANTAIAGDKTVEFDVDDAAMNQAQAEARAHLEMFLDSVMDPSGRTLEGATIKVALPVGDNNFEVIWVGPFMGVGGDRFIGNLANAPNDLPNLQRGSQIEFSRDQVRDWAFWSDQGRMYGSFTTRVILPLLDPTEAAQISAILTDTPLPEGW